MHLKFKANNIYGHGTENKTREIVANKVSLLSVFCWYYPIIQFKQAQTEVTIDYTENGTKVVHAVRKITRIIENYMIELPITWLGLKFWKLCRGVGRSPESAQMNRNTTVRKMYGRGWYLDGKLYRLAHVTKYQIIQLRERPAVMWGIKKSLQLLFDVNSS